jgi:adenine-specific DNA-methyltransferase
MEGGHSADAILRRGEASPFRAKSALRSGPRRRHPERHHRFVEQPGGVAVSSSATLRPRVSVAYGCGMSRVLHSAPKVTLSRRTKAPQSAAKVTSTTNSGRFSKQDADKLRGGYYTSTAVASWLCKWAIRTPDDRVLEPSCGAGAFVEAAAVRFAELGLSGPSIAEQLNGIEVLAAEAERARSRLQPLVGVRAQSLVETSDFFEWWQRHERRGIDAVVGNPPFIRYQNFPEPSRTKAMEIMQRLGLTPNRLTNIWVPFVVAAAASLRPGGRLGLVLPAELLQVSYAAQLRSFLTERFTRIDIVACNELFFEGAEQEVILLLADGALPKTAVDNPCRVTLTEAKTVSEIVARDPKELLDTAQPKIVRHDNEKWLKFFLTAGEIDFMRQLRESIATTTLASHASVDVGVVTGKNEFFVLNDSQVVTLGVENFVTPLVSRSVQLLGAQISKTEWRALSAGGDRVFLLDLKHLNGKKPTGALARYILAGEESDVHKGYKCSIRKPWYAVPSIWVPDGFLFRQIYDFPRIVLNKAKATSTDTIHRLTCTSAKPETLIRNTYTWLTAASAEIEGRSYGGGVLELEPTEAERLLVPKTLTDAMSLTECDRLVRDGRLDDVLNENARLILKHHMGLSQRECQQLRIIWERMRDRRMARRRSERSNEKPT